MSSRPTMSPRRLVTAALALALVPALTAPVAAAPPASAPPAQVPAGQAADGFHVEVLSSRADYVSGGDARVAIDVPRNVPPHRVRVAVDGRDVTDAFEVDRDARRLEGVVDGLELGTQVLEVRANGQGRGRPQADLELTNHPLQGPMFSGPHQTPFFCQTEAAGLGPALDDDCFAETKVDFLYRTTAGSFAPLPDGPRPADLAQTTTTSGETVDYIVRRETGVINRAVYQTTVLYDPDVADTDAPEATPGWNGRLVYSYGGGCNAAYAQGTGNGGVLSDLHLSQGYAMASSSLNVLNNNCNDVLSAETTSMVKEHFIETYGADVHTIGWGGSGGAISQHLIAHNYPGLLDGLVPTLNYPDATSIFSGIGDCRLLFNYFAGAPAGLWDATAQTAVAGFPDWTDCLAWNFSFANRIDATTGCNPIVPPAIVFDPVTNPDGVRCNTADDAINVLGVDPSTGYAPLPDDNLGVQYGLEALNDGAITAEQFLDLNEGIPGFDGNGEVVAGRTGPSPVIGRMYETGRITTGTGLATAPILHVRPYLDAIVDIHTRWYTFNTRERLLRDTGTADNQVVWVYGLATPPAVQAQIAADALATMDAWIGAIEADTLERTQSDVIAARPDAAVDTCWDAAGTAIVEPVSYDGDTACNELYPSAADPRQVAGAPLSGDVLACQLRPLDPADYEVAFTPDQWTRLEAAFPQGVCDYDQPGIGQGTWAGPWQSFGGGS